MHTIIWTDYIKYRANLRGFSLEIIEEIIRYSGERYFDNTTQRLVVIGNHENRIVMIPYDQDEKSITPITIHATTRQQIKFRMQTKRFTT
jgi:hypothetical protein